MGKQVSSEILQMITDFSNAKGPSGFEDEVILAAKKHLGSGFDTEEDCLRNFYMHRKANTGNKPVFLLDAHSDEVGFMVHSIRANGTLRFVALGGWNISSLPSTKVLVRNAEGRYIPGIIAAKPVHFMSASEKASAGPADISTLSIDIGAVDAQEAKEVFKIRIGEPVVADVSLEYDAEHDLLFGKAFDCRIGCAALLETLHRLKDEALDVDVTGVLSSQEEVGERGMKVAVHHTKPDIAICFEGCPADDTFTEAYAVQTAFKKGPMLRFMDKSIICTPRYQRYALDLAERLGIPVQSSVREGGGNNGAILHTSFDGIPTIVIGVPVRYIHTVHGITSCYDFEATVRLATELVRSMNQDIIDSF
ncbi:MAG: M42 family metallopeptidase [Lachnospiraceae bacterium]|jgi:putative aminopeptidase FrvX|nr:M42 family metallopeptidase [Lachnospiraceae bacterium]NBJ83095.1 M42 family peptidase [bacterium 1XD42-76]NBK06386.1 M42 family peptidase [bacterium 1XD42-94]